MTKFLRKLFFIILLVLLLVIVVILTITYNSFKYALRGEHAIDTEEFIEINGQNQFIQIRGKDKNNPIILFLHGGPGSPHAFMSPYYQKEFEGQFTFVNWDQRAGGRTYYANEAENPVDMDIIYSDL